MYVKRCFQPTESHVGSKVTQESSVLLLVTNIVHKNEKNE